MKTYQFRVNGYSEIEREKCNLINSTSKTLKQLENYKNEWRLPLGLMMDVKR